MNETIPNIELIQEDDFFELIMFQIALAIKQAKQLENMKDAVIQAKAQGKEVTCMIDQDTGTLIFQIHERTM